MFYLYTTLSLTTTGDEFPLMEPAKKYGTGSQIRGGGKICVFKDFKNIFKFSLSR